MVVFGAAAAEGDPDGDAAGEGEAGVEGEEAGEGDAVGDGEGDGSGSAPARPVDAAQPAIIRLAAANRAATETPALDTIEILGYRRETPNS